MKKIFKFVLLLLIGGIIGVTIVNVKPNIHSVVAENEESIIIDKGAVNDIKDDIKEGTNSLIEGIKDLF